nr:MAG TPA: dUTPase [Caudoviricetes sp.]
MKVKVKKLVENAVIPHYAKSGDAGLDLTVTSVENKGDKIVYHCGLAFEIPQGFFGLVVPRSSNAKKDLLLTNSAGIIDSGYRGEVTAVFYKTRLLHPDLYQVGERFAQLVIMPYPQIELEESEDLSTTERGTGGYGSTGK